MQDIQHMPVVGVGASLSFGVPPNPVTLADMDNGPDFIEYAGSVDAGLYAQDIAALHASNTPTLYHPSCLNLCGPWPNPKSWLQAVENHVQHVKSPWLAQDVSVCFVEEPGYSIQLGYFVGPILSKKSLEQAVQRVLEVRAIVSCPMLLEPPPATWRVGDMSMIPWLNELAHRTGCGLLIDSGHLYAHCLVEKKNLLSDIDFDLVVEIHVAGGSIGVHKKRRYYTDDHRLPIQPEVWAVFDKLLTCSPNLKAVCYECEGAMAGSVIPMLNRIRHRVLQYTKNDALRQFVRNRMDGKAKDKIANPIPTQRHPNPLPTNIVAGYKHVLRLLFDQHVRELYSEDIEQCAQELGCEKEWLSGIDIHGVGLDAEGRCEYIMASLCRLYPWSTAIIGSHPQGREALQQFLSSPHILGDINVRNDLFAEHLLRILSFQLFPSSLTEPILAFVQAERGLAKNRATLREFTQAGGELPTIPTDKTIHGVFHFSPYTMVAQLPFSTTLLEGVMGCTADQVWRVLQGGGFGWEQMKALLRADTESVTFLCRAIPKGYQAQIASAGVVAPSMEIEQKTIELTGSSFLPISQLKGKPLAHCMPEQQRFAQHLIHFSYGYFAEQPIL